MPSLNEDDPIFEMEKKLANIQVDQNSIDEQVPDEARKQDFFLKRRTVESNNNSTFSNAYKPILIVVALSFIGQMLALVMIVSFQNLWLGLLVAWGGPIFGLIYVGYKMEDILVIMGCILVSSSLFSFIFQPLGFWVGLAVGMSYAKKPSRYLS